MIKAEQESSHNLLQCVVVVAQQSGEVSERAARAAPHLSSGAHLQQRPPTAISTSWKRGRQWGGQDSLTYWLTAPLSLSRASLCVEVEKQ